MEEEREENRGEGKEERGKEEGSGERKEERRRGFCSVFNNHKIYIFSTTRRNHGEGRARKRRDVKLFLENSSAEEEQANKKRKKE